MSDAITLVDRICELIAAALVIAALGVGVALTSPETADATHISVAAFNIQVFGKTKRGNADVMEVLVDIAQQFDLMAVQEVRDATMTTADVFLDQINADSELTYAMVEGPRLGRTSSKEQYVIYYIPARIRLLRSYTFPDPDDTFEREPLVATFRADGFDFTVVMCHIKPDHAEAELQALAEAVDPVLDANPSEQDIILLGDFNADGSYLNEANLPGIFPPDRFQIVIADHMDTMTTSDNTYDRIILMDATTGHEYVADSAGVFEFDLEFGIQDEAFVKKVSDHYPVSAEFQTDLPDDDGTP